MKIRYIYLIAWLASLPSICDAQQYRREELPALLRKIDVAPPDTTRVYLLLQAAHIYIMKAGELREDMDSALTMIKQAEALSRKSPVQTQSLRASVLKGTMHMELREYQQAKNLLLSAAEGYQRLGKKVESAHAIAVYALYLPHSNNEKKTFLRQAELAYKAAEDKKAALDIRLNYVGHQYSKGILDSALINSTVLLNEWQNVKGPEVAGVYLLRSAIHMQYGNYHAVLEDVLSALNIVDSEEWKDSDFSKEVRFFINRDVGRAYYHLNNHKKAIEWYALALEEAKTKYPDNIYANCLCYLVKSMIQEGKPGDALSLIRHLSRQFPPLNENEKQGLTFAFANCYDALHQDELAEKYYKISNAPVSRALNDLKWDYLNAEARFYLSRGKYKDAKLVALKIVNTNDSTTKSIFAKETALFTLYRADSAMGNHSLAMQFLKRHMDLKEFIFERNKSRQIEELTIQYETGKKDQELILLTEQSETQRQQQRAIIAVVILLSLIVVLIYRLYRNKQKSNSQLIHLLDEKEWLLKEIHHRVKNNLQTVLSLLESQSRTLSNEAFDALQESQNRVYAMSLIHKKLYQSNDVSSINTEDYLRDLVQHLRDSFGSSGNIRFSLQLDSIELDVSQAVPVGLIVNEAVTNSIKYAFPHRKEDNEISISFKKLNENSVILVITDNGVGISTPKESPPSLGLKLMRGLTEDIDGIFAIESNHGVTIKIEFVANMPFQKIAEAPASRRILQTA